MTSPLAAVEHNLREFRALKDTFNHLEWWRANGDKVPAFKFVLRAVLANSPNSIPPERMFSVLTRSSTARSTTTRSGRSPTTWSSRCSSNSMSAAAPPSARSAEVPASLRTLQYVRTPAH